MTEAPVTADSWFTLCLALCKDFSKMSKTTSALLDLHFRDVGNHPIRTAQEEHTLFTAYQEARTRAELATNPVEREQFQKLRDTLRNAIASGYYRFVIKQARRKAHDDALFAELLSAGYEGLLHAITLFDPARGNRFLTYAANWVNVKMQEVIYRMRTVHVPNHTRKAMRRTRVEKERKQVLGEPVEDFEEPSIASIDNVVIIDDNVDIESDVQRRRVDPLALLAQAQLTRVERLVLIYAFGLRGGEPKDARTIGQILYEIDGSQMTAARVEGIQKRALNRLRAHLSEEEIKSLADILS